MSWNIGSVVDEVSNRIDDIPESISGSNMNNIIIGEINFAEKFIDKSIGSEISEKYQGVITDLSMSKVQQFVETVGTDGKNVKLGELSISQKTSQSSSSSKMRTNAIERLKEFRNDFNSYQAW